MLTLDKFLYHTVNSGSTFHFLHKSNLVRSTFTYKQLLLKYYLEINMVETGC